MTYKASDSFFLIHQLQDFFKWEKSKIIGHSLGESFLDIFDLILAFSLWMLEQTTPVAMAYLTALYFVAVIAEI